MKKEKLFYSQLKTLITQQEVLDAIEEEKSEVDDTPSENESNTDEEAEEEYWQKAGNDRGSDDEETCDSATVALHTPPMHEGGLRGPPPRRGGELQTRGDQARPLPGGRVEGTPS
jgi:hypothetical protein